MTEPEGVNRRNTSDESFALDDEALAALPSSLATGLLADRVVIISGGGSGIGRSTAWLAARAGAQGIVSGRTQEKLKRVSAGPPGRGLRCDAVTVRIRDASPVDAGVTSVLQ